MGIMYKFPIDGEVEMPEEGDRRKALANIASNREKLKAFESSAPPDLMSKLTACVDEYEDEVREFRGMEPRPQNNG